MILLLDNYDSFTYNLAQALSAFDRVEVRKNDEVDVHRVKRMKPSAIVISPGPGHPAKPRDFGVCAQVLRELSPKVPTLGVCLGHQGIVHAYGGRVVHAREPVHGKVRRITHDRRGLFRGLPNPLLAVRYHSLVAEPESLPDALEVTARCEGEIMGVRHREYPIEGVQFHPESIGTPQGEALLRNFMRMVRRRKP